MSKKPVYEREVKSLTPSDVQSAISYSDSKAIVGKVAEWRDKKTTGLTLRITPGKAVWYVRRREMTLRLGSATDIDLDQARYFAEQTNLAAKRKRNLREFVDTLVSLEATSKYKDRMGQAEIADQFADETSLLAYRKRIGDTGVTWTWKALTHEFLQYQKPKLKASYREKYAHYLTLEEFSFLNDKPVNEVKLRDLERVRDDILRNHARSTVHRAVTQSKKMLTWAWRFKATLSGLDEVEAEWWNRWSFESAPVRGTTRPRSRRSPASRARRKIPRSRRRRTRDLRRYDWRALGSRIDSTENGRISEDAPRSLVRAGQKRQVARVEDRQLDVGRDERRQRRRPSILAPHTT